MTILYGQLGMDKRLRDVVFAGSHDAGITTGGGNAQTQSKNIYNQALAGVRIFDLRIMAGSVGSGNGKQARMMAYHAGGGIKKETKSRVMEGTGKTETIVRSKLKVGNFGLGLKSMLEDANKFVSIYKTEFLIFKFDKCTNWKLIAEYCTDFLGDRLYDGKGDLNRKTLQNLKGKVIVLFSKDGIDDLGQSYPPGKGIFGFRNLFGKEGGPKDYDPKFNGLQYFGKGGTSLSKGARTGYSGKAKLNVKKQGALMSQMADASGAAAHSSNVLGMIYWTTTGIFENIQSRDKSMWNPSGIGDLKTLWEGGLKESIETRTANSRIKKTSYASGVQMKAFMPNIVMIDFADAKKCEIIYGLNKLAATHLTKMFQKDEDDSSSE